MARYDLDTVDKLFRYKGQGLSQNQLDKLGVLESLFVELAKQIVVMVPENAERTRGLNGLLDSAALLKRAITHHGDGA